MIEKTTGSLDNEEKTKIDMIIKFKEEVKPFSPSVNVTISNTVYDNLIQQVNASNILMLSLGSCIVNQKIDDWSNVATLEIVRKVGNIDIFQLQKHYLYQTKHYVVTISQLSTSQLQNTPKILTDLKTIAQSFSFI